MHPLKCNFFSVDCILPNETVIAISRAKTQRCKNEFKDLACAIQAGTVYPREIIRLVSFSI